MPGCIVSATTSSFRSVEKRRLRATPVITSTLENVSDIGTCLGLSLGPPASTGVRSKRGALHLPPKEYGQLGRCDQSLMSGSSPQIMIWLYWLMNAVAPVLTDIAI